MIIARKKKRNLLETIFMVEIVKGMALTFSRLFAKPVTREYPTMKRRPFLGFRGQQALVRDTTTGRSKCVSCMRCASVCPSQCIHIHFHKDAQSGQRVLDSYELDSFRCIYCGYCEEVCPVSAIVLTEVYEYTAFQRQDNYYDENKLLDNWDRFLAESGHSAEQYINPFWQQRGMERTSLAAARRKPVPDEWTQQGQVVGKLANRSASSHKNPEGGQR